MIRLADPLDRASAREFRCTVHGLCFENRYRMLEGIHAGDPLVLRREPDNAIGADAIQVDATQDGLRASPFNLQAGDTVYVGRNERAVYALGEVSEHAGGRPVHVIGWSLGGIFAALAAADGPRFALLAR